MIHLIEERGDGQLLAYQCLDHDHLTKRDALLMAAFLHKNPKARGIVTAPISTALKLEKVDFLPWEKAAAHFS